MPTFQGTPEWYGGKEGIIKKLVERGESESNAPFVPYRPAEGQERYAPFSPLQTQSFQSAQQEVANPLYSQMFGEANRRISQAGNTQVAPQLSPYLNRATAPTNLNFSSYMNPYQDAVANKLGALASRNLTENILPKINTNFINAGQYGSSVHQGLTNRAIRDTQEGVSTAQGNLLREGYESAREASLRTQGAERERELQAAQLRGATGTRDIDRQMMSAEALANLATQQQTQGLKGSAVLNQLGGQQQAQDQQGRNFAWEEFQRELNYPFYRTARLSELVRGLPPMAQQFSNSYTPAPPCV